MFMQEPSWLMSTLCSLLFLIRTTWVVDFSAKLLLFFLGSISAAYSVPLTPSRFLPRGGKEVEGRAYFPRFLCHKAFLTRNRKHEWLENHFDFEVSLGNGWSPLRQWVAAGQVSLISRLVCAAKDKSLRQNTC